MSDDTLLPLGPLYPDRIISEMYYLSKYVSMPDTCNLGPVVGFRKKATVGNSTEYQPEFVSRKTSSNTPWKRTQPCSVPCSKPVEASLPPVDPYLTPQISMRCCRGNLLQSFSLQGQDSMMVATNTSNILHLHKVTQHKQYIKLQQTVTFQMSSKINDLQCKEIDGNLFILTRSLKNVDLHRLNNNCLQYCNKSMKAKINITSAELCNEFPGLWIQSNELQRVSLFDSSRKSHLWSGELCNELTEPRKPQWCCCVFADQSYTGFAANRTSIYTCDFREKGFNNLFHIHNFCESIKLDEVCGLVPLSNRPYLFAMLEDQVLLLDQRSCRVPVLSWNHSLSHLPWRAVVANLGETDLLVIANYLGESVGIVGVQGCSTKLDTFERHVKSEYLASYWDVITPMKDYARRNGIWQREVINDRLKSNMTGVACIKYNDNTEYDILASNEYGDVFSQRFSLYSMDGAQARCNHEIVKQMKAWEKCIKDSPKADTCMTYDASECLNRLLKKSPSQLTRGRLINITDDNMWDVPLIVETCRNQAKHRKAIANLRPIEWLDIVLDEYNKAEKCVSNLVFDDTDTDPMKKYFSNAVYKSVKESRLMACSDHIAHVILSTWPLEQPTDAEVTQEQEIDQYRTVPFSQKLTKYFIPRKLKRREQLLMTDESVTSDMDILQQNDNTDGVLKDIIVASDSIYLASALPELPKPSSHSNVGSSTHSHNSVSSEPLSRDMAGSNLSSQELFSDDAASQDFFSNIFASENVSCLTPTSQTGSPSTRALSVSVKGKKRKRNAGF